MKNLVLSFLLGLAIGFAYLAGKSYFQSEMMTVVSVGYNEHSVFGFGHGFWEYWANNEETGNSYHGISFNLVKVGQKVRINK